MLPLNLNGSSLGQRHRQLNEKVREAFSSKFNFDEIKKLPENSDVDRIFKIDLASKMEDTNFIIETLKSGDEFYASRALKCSWLYDDKHADVINCDFLHNNVFPFMSQAMVNETLTVISVNLKNDARTFDFYMYCVSNKRNHLAKKFLSRTSTDRKLMTVNNNNEIHKVDIKVHIRVIGNSFSLAESYLKNNVSHRKMMLYNLRYLYSVSNEEYLSLLEKYFFTERSVRDFDRERDFYRERDYKWKFGLRISKSIVLKHKDRILRNPSLYVKLLNLKMLLKYLNGDDVKSIISSLLPAEVEEFWEYHYYDSIRDFLNVLPFEERFSFLKSIYRNKYPLSEFEMRKEFFYQYLYTLMSEEQKEVWALRQLECNNEIFGGYNLYQFVNFEKGFVELKKLIYKETSSYRRLKLIKVITKAARTPKDINALLTYLCKRHINESTCKDFVSDIIRTHNVLEFDETCWNLFSELLHHIGVYNPRKDAYYISQPRLIALFYHILHDKPFPADLLEECIFGENLLCHSDSRLREILKKVHEAKHEIIFKSFSQTLTDKLAQYDLQNFHVDDVKQIIISFKCLNEVFEKTDYPDVLVEFAKKNEECYSLLFESPPSVEDKPVTEDQLLQLLNKDLSLFNAKISNAIKESSDSTFRIKRLFRKLKIYFFEDAAKLWMKKFTENLDGIDCPDRIAMAIFSVFLLADNAEKKELMLKYAPENPKIEYATTSSIVLYIQAAICRLSMYSRPTLLPDFIPLYLKGDYVRYCIPMFNFYAAHLTYPECLKFIESLLDEPISIKKHGIGLTFRSGFFDKLMQPIQEVWKKNKNVSLRRILFLAVYDDICNESDELRQREKFRVLKTMINNLDEDDDPIIFTNLASPNHFPDNICGELLECVYVMYQRMPDKKDFLTRKSRILSSIQNKIGYMREQFIDELIEKFVNDLLSAQAMPDDVQTYYVEEKMELISKYIINSKSEDRFSKKMTVLEKIVYHCADMWDRVEDNIYITRKLFEEFVDNISDSAHDVFCNDYYVKPLPLFVFLLKTVTSNLPIQSTYWIVWKLKLIIIYSNIIYAHKEEKFIDEMSKRNALPTAFGREISVLLSQFTAENLYFPTMLPGIICIIQEYMNRLCTSDLDIENIKVLVASTLLNIDSTPSCIIVIDILPLESSDKYDEEYRSILEKLKLSNDSEVKCQYYQKFYQGYKRRKYV